MLWSDVKNKNETVYLPILKAFLDEFNRLYDKHKEKVLTKFIDYLLGTNFDYYKLVQDKNFTRIIVINKNGSLSSPFSILYPNKIIDFSFINDSQTTLVLTADNNWKISVRIHNASSIVESSLKLDIRLVEKPDNFSYFDQNWS
jgi:transcriptional regulatory protein LevR